MKKIESLGLEMCKVWLYQEEYRKIPLYSVEGGYDMLGTWSFLLFLISLFLLFSFTSAARML